VSEAKPWIGPNGQVMRRLELHLTYTCPEKCVFCSEEHRMKSYQKFPVTWGRVATVLRKHAERGVTNVHFTGGEPTIHKQFVRVLELAKKLNMRTSIGTIGTMLARPDFAARAIPHLDEALFSLHGPDAETHDALTRRPGSFETVTTAIRNTKRVNPDFRVFVNTVLTKHNASVLPQTVAYAESLGAELIVISNTTPEGGGDDHYAKLAVSLEELAQVLPRAASAVSTAVLRFFGTPMCLLGDYWAWSNDLHWDPRVTTEWATEPGKVVFTDLYNWAPDRRRVQVDSCATCTRKEVCMGVFDEYARRWPTDALRPHP
jgi:MoaA/NifB/PqqE/SkfB family radical SAM enzyme